MFMKQSFINAKNNDTVWNKHNRNSEYLLEQKRTIKPQILESKNKYNSGICEYSACDNQHTA